MSGQTAQDTQQITDATSGRDADGSPVEKSLVAGNPFAPLPERAYDKGEKVYAYVQVNGRTKRVIATVVDHTDETRKWEYWLKGADQRWYKEKELSEAD